MPLEVPNLDDRRWTDLVEDGRTLIPQLAPRWTDHNVHDPGITFSELFAWLAEMQIYQLNRVGDRHREVFGRLAGVRRRRHSPARVDVVATGVLAASVVLPAETQLTPLEGDEIVFETTRAVVLTRSRLQRVIVDDGSGPVDHTEANEKRGIAFLALGEQAQTGAQLQLGFDRFYPSEEPTIRLAIDVFSADLATRCGPELPMPAHDAGVGASIRPVELAWEYLGANGGWRPLAVIDDETAALAQPGALTLSVPADAQTHNTHVWIRGRIRRGYYDIEPRIRHVGLNSLPCVQRETVRNEVLGRGNGRANQSFILSKGPILLPDDQAPVLIEVDNERWELVSSYDEAGPDSKQFVFDADSRTVLFGNGLNGQVPMPGQTVSAVWYQASIGALGNVAKDLRWKFRARVVPGVTLTNAQPAVGGGDPESLSDLELRARALLNRPTRAVTLNDIERLALATPNAHVARAVAIPNCPSPERITVVAVPKIRPGRKGPPRPPSAAFLNAIDRFLQRRRLLGDDLRVVAPIYIEVRVAARLRLAKGAGAVAVIERARQALERFFGGDDLDVVAAQPRGAGDVQSPCPSRWPLGRSVFPSEVYAALDRVPGVDAVSGLTLSGYRGRTSITRDHTGAIPVPRIGLVFSGSYDLTVDLEPRSAG